MWGAPAPWIAPKRIGGTTPAPDPRIALQSRHPGCLGEGAQEGEVAASASDCVGWMGAGCHGQDLCREPWGTSVQGAAKLRLGLGYVSGCLCVSSVIQCCPSWFQPTRVCLCRGLSACASHVQLHLSGLGSMWLHCQASPLLRHSCGSCICFLPLLTSAPVRVSDCEQPLL